MNSGLYTSAEYQASVERVIGHCEHRPGYVYWTLVAAFVGTCVALPLVSVDIAVRAAGVVRPKVERTIVTTPVDGFVKLLPVVDNAFVYKGDVLVVLESKILEERWALNRAQQAELREQIDDLRLLLGSARQADAVDAETIRQDLLGRLKTPASFQQLEYFLAQAELKAVVANRARREFTRVAGLHERRLVADQEYETAKYNVDAAVADRGQFFRQNLSNWEFDLAAKEARFATLVSEGEQLAKQREAYTVAAPVEGTALGFSGFAVGSFVPAGSRLGEVSPSGEVNVEAYINPKDIGFVSAGQPVQLQVDAFPYAQWGSLHGIVDSVSQDLVQNGTQPVFRARIALTSTRLRSARGTSVAVTKGMTVSARLLVTRRTLWQLVYQRMSDALDPTGPRS